MDDRRRVAMVETKTVDTSVSGGFTVTPRYRFQLDDHVWSARLECDDAGLVISYEEFHPYGTSAYRSARSGIEVSERRFRYTGKERDEETGFQIHGLRYYCPWLGRWTTADPIGLQGGVNQYAYCRGDPVGKVDPGGTDAGAAQGHLEQAQRELARRNVEEIRQGVGAIRDGPATSGSAKAAVEAVGGFQAGMAKAGLGLLVATNPVNQLVAGAASLAAGPEAKPQVPVEEAALNAVNENLNPAYSGALAYEQGKEALAEGDYDKVGEAGADIAVSAVATSRRWCSHRNRSALGRCGHQRT